MTKTDDCKKTTYEFLGLATVLNLNVGLAILAEDLEGEVLDIRLHFGVVELATNESLSVEDTVINVRSGVHSK